MCTIFHFWTLKILIIGGAKGDRTPDLYAASVALSQLSYGPNYLSVYSQQFSSSDTSIAS